MSGTRWADVAVAVTAALRAGLTCDVFDGPPNSGDALSDFVCVGNHPDTDEPSAGRIEQEYHDLGPSATKEERGEIACYASAWDGDADLPATRARAFATLEAIQTVLRANQTLGLTGVRAPEIEVSTGSVMQGYTTSGVRVDLTFTLSYITLV